MADYVILDSEKEIECPYDKSHMVRKKRMQYHLIKCRRNHAASKDFATCPYNATHEMPKPELRHHMSVCSDKAMVEKTLRYEEAKRMDDGSILKGCTDVPAYDSYNLSSSENWDLEVSSRPRMGVDPSFFHMQTRRSLAGMTPLEKRQFHTSLAPDIKDLNEPEHVNEYRPVGMAPAISKPIKVRLPKAKSEAQTYQEQKSQQPQPIIQPSQVFQYSLAMAGVGRGGGAPQANNQSTPSVGRGVSVNTTPPTSLQAYSMKTGNTRQNIDSPPPSIMNFMMKQRLKPSSNSSNSNENSGSETFSDDDDIVTPGTNGHVTINSSNEIQSQASETTVMSPKSHGVALHQNHAVYNPPIKPTSSLTTTGIGRGARLLNGNQNPTIAVSSYTNSWSSMVNGSANGEQSQSLPPSAFYASNNINDFPTLNKSDNAKVAQEKEIVDSKDVADSNEILETAKKVSKGLRKKLIGISKLEEKQKKGTNLTPDEEIKLSKRKTLEDQLASLSVY